MKLQAFSFRDTKAETFAAPFFVPNAAIAKRLASQLVLDQRSDLGKYPADFLLYCVGSYDTETARLEPQQVELICTVSSCLPKPDPRQLSLEIEKMLPNGAAVGTATEA